MKPLLNRIGKRSRATRTAFTLIELLVVIAVLAILATIILPALSTAKGRGYAVACINNHRQLTLAWTMYADEHEDYIPYNYGTAGTLGTISSGQYLNWANNVMSWDLEPYNTNTLQLAAGGLGPYLSGVVHPYRCPADRVLSNVQKGAGWVERDRSVSMNAMLGYAGEFMEGTTNVNNPGYKQFFKLSDIHNTSRIFVFIDEHPDSINDGYFLEKFGMLQWFDLPAAYHNGGANVSFADMHVEYRKWVSASTLVPMFPEAADLPGTIPPDDRADYDWIMERMSYRTQSSSSGGYYGTGGNGSGTGAYGK